MTNCGDLGYFDIVVKRNVITFLASTESLDNYPENIWPLDIWYFGCSCVLYTNSITLRGDVHHSYQKEKIILPIVIPFCVFVLEILFFVKCEVVCFNVYYLVDWLVVTRFLFVLGINSLYAFKVNGLEGLKTVVEDKEGVYFVYR